MQTVVSQPIEIKVGVWEGCIISSLLFNTVRDVVMCNSMCGHREISLSLLGDLGDLDYVGDICPSAHRYSDVVLKIQSPAKRAAKAGLQININKTKSMGIHASNTDKFQLMDHHIDIWVVL